jgi:hypothetical protein
VYSTLRKYVPYHSSWNNTKGVSFGLGLTYSIFGCYHHLQDYLGIPRGTVRATVLIETLPAAFEMEEILYELRDHAAGLNAGTLHVQVIVFLSIILSL